MAYVKSVLWLAGFGGFAYFLLETITPKDSEIIKYLPEGQVHHRRDPNQPSAFFQTLKRVSKEQKSMIQEETNSKTSTAAEK